MGGLVLPGVGGMAGAAGGSHGKGGDMGWARACWSAAHNRCSGEGDLSSVLSEKSSRAISGRSPHASPAPRLSRQLIYLPPPWGTCKAVTMDSDFFDSYSITACRIDCETRYLVENCNCRMVHMPGGPPPRLCMQF